MSARNQISIPSLSFHNILFALDFSPGSLLALPFAATIAAHYRSKLFILRILSVEEDQSYPLTSQAALEKLEAGAEAGMFGTLGALKDIPHEFLFDHGSICSTLVAVADKCKVDLIVLGTHGWRGIKKLLKGSTAEEIDFLATRPVLIVGPKVESQPEFKRILFATSVSQTSPVALLYAFSFAHAYQASVVALHVNPQIPTIRTPQRRLLMPFVFFAMNSRIMHTGTRLKGRKLSWSPVRWKSVFCSSPQPGKSI